MASLICRIISHTATATALVGGEAESVGFPLTLLHLLLRILSGSMRRGRGGECVIKANAILTALLISPLPSLLGGVR